MKVDSILIDNIQSHLKTRLNLSPGVNAIIGLSDQGKTGIVRALRLLKDHRPMGADYMPNYEKDRCDGKVAILTDTQLEISLQKEYRINKKGEKVVDSSFYTIKDHGKKKGSYETGRDVPDVVKEALNFDPLNLHEQLDLPFLVTSSAGDIARDINRITHLEPVDSWISTITTKINKINSEIEFTKQEIKEGKEKLEKYSHLDSLESILKKVERLEQVITSRNAKTRELSRSIDSLIEVSNTIGILTIKLRAEGIIEKAKAIDQRIDAITSQQTHVKSLITIEEAIKDIKSHLERVEPFLAKLQRIQLQIDYIKTDPLHDLIERLRQLELGIEIQVEELEETKIKYIDLIQEEEECPFCHSQIDEKAIKRIKGAL